MWCGPLALCPTLQPMNERVMTEGTLAVSVPGGELIGVRSGSGRPLLVLHGGPAVNDYSDWFAAELAGWDAFRYSCESLVARVDLRPWLAAGQLGWCITGGESGGAKRREMSISWLESIAGQCRAAGVPVFTKQDPGPRPGMQGRIPDAIWALKQFPGDPSC
jgi:hypothetical protein